MADKSITREERYLEYLTGDRKGNVPKPVTRRERYLYELCLKGIGGEISPEEIKNAVNEYLEKNPVKPGATTEQVQQIEQNKTDIVSLKTETSSLKESISNKITKFYASSQGETHLADSDNGKIMDMMLYGKSEQKQYSGKNLVQSFWNEKVSKQYEIPLYIKTELKPSHTYTLSFICEKGYLGYINEFLFEQITFTGTGTRQSVICKTKNTIDSAQLSNYGYAIVKNFTGNTVIPNFSNVMFEDGESMSNTYEPYTGGIPSPNPDYPQEIKSVVNPTVKIVGKNLLKATLQTTTKDGVTCTANGDGTYTLNGTATATGIFILHSNIDFTGQMRLCGGTSLVSLQYSNSSNFAYEDKGTGIIIEHFDSVTYPNASFNILIKTDNVYNNVLVKPMLTTDLTATYDDYEPYHEQIVTLPYTLNAIPVESDGNVTIGGQQYIADYVDVERGKLVRIVDSSKLDNTQSIVGKTEWLLAEPQEIDLTTEEITTFKALATYYPTTNISVNSEQLDGYTVFNYPIPFEDEWIKTKKDVDSLKARLNDIIGYDNAAAHNAIYRGKYLGTQFTAEMSANIKNGTFKDLYCGDYLVINGTTYRFMDLDYLYKTGDTSLETHHILVVPDAPMYNHVMNDTNTTSGGYVGSKMYISGLDQALAKIKADFGEAHIVTYRNLLVNTVSNGIPSSWAWYSRQIDLMNEEMVYGTRAWSQATQNGYDTSSNKSQLAAFKHNHSLISSCRSWYWLRAVYSSTDFCNVGSSGNAGLNGASDAGGVRPCFLIS